MISIPLLLGVMLTYITVHLNALGGIWANHIKTWHEKQKYWYCGCALFPQDMHKSVTINYISYKLSREYRVVRNRYSRLLFTSEDRLCANFCVLEESMNITSQCQCLAFAWRHRSTVMTSQCLVRKDRPWRQWRNGWSMIVCSGTVCSRYEIAWKKWNNTFVTVNKDFWSLVRCFANDFHSWKSLANHPTRDQKIVIHGNSCIILYILWLHTNTVFI